ncbi:MAG: hypothetical protein WDW36_005834 [Sanguina aurantia]
MFPGMGGAGGAGGFDFSALQQALSDPAIKEMAEQIAKDPSFLEVTKQLQESFGGMMGGMGAPGAGGAPGGMPPGFPGFPPGMLANMMGGGAGGAPGGMPAGFPGMPAGFPGMPAGFPGMPAGFPGMPGMPGADGAAVDPSKYMGAFSSMFSNPQFMQMAEKLGKTIIEADPNMTQMMQSMQDPTHKAKIEDAMKGLKDDPSLKPMMDELEASGPMAMMKYWNDPEILQKLGKAMGGAFELPGAALAAGEATAEDEGGDENGAEPEATEENLHSAATDGDIALLTQLIEGGADLDEVDEEGRTALHFACGYGELECAKALIAAKAGLNLIDHNKNTPLHYAAGYGQAESCKLLVDSGADKDALNLDGKTALEVAQLNEQSSVIEALGGEAATA